jgi:glycosyltransferase involved in cell wall biosynthesis
MIIIYPANTIFPSPRANTIQILNTARELAVQENQVHLVAKKTTATLPEIAEFYGLPPTPLFNMHLVAAPRIFRSAKGHESLVLKNTIQILSHYRTLPKIVYTRDPLFASILLKMKRIFQFRLVYEAHTLFFLTGKETYMPIAWNKKKEERLYRRERRIFQQSDAVVFITASLRKLVEQHFPIRQPWKVIHDGTQVPQAISDTKKQGAVCYSGQLYLWKGMLNLLKSMAHVKDAVLHIHGGGYSTVHDDLREMEKVIDEYHLRPKVQFHGFVVPSKLPEAIQGYPIGVLPLPANTVGSQCNSPLKLFDYMANGLAVVASDLPTIREIIEHGKNGHLVEADNPKDLADGINRLIHDPPYTRSLAQEAFRTVQKYSWHQRGSELHQFLLSVF